MYDSSAPRFSDGFFTVADGLRLHYRDYPGDTARPPILCLPGLTRNARDFAALAERLSPRFRVLCLDFRGRGGSDFDPEPGRYLPPTYARDTIALLDHLGIERAIFVGTSLGGIVTMIVAAMAGQRITAAILNDVGPELSEVGLDRIRNYVGSGKTFATWAEAAEAVADNQSRLPAAWGAAEWEEMARRMCRTGGDGTIHFDYDPAIAEPFRLATGRPDVDMWPLFDALAEHPLLVVRGERSELFTDAALTAMAKRSPNVSTVTVAGAGHAPELDEPEAVAAIDAFLENAPG
ncbi:MAG: alpha/beta hydrolase [Pseudomonadota bacterium]|nr:alpha/beta hydrolase [Pseudomonadota bacterium]